MAIALNDNIKINAGKPIDTRYLNSGNTSYPTEASVFTGIPISERYVGLTVLVNSGTVGNTELWFKTGVTDTDLIEKKYDSILPVGDYVTGGTTLGYFSGYAGIQTLPITNLPDANYNGSYFSLYNYYYRGIDGIVHVGIPIDGIQRRGYVKTSGLVKSWIWNEYVGGSDLLGWALIDGNVSNQIGTFQYSAVPLYYNGTTTFPYSNTGWTTGSAYNNGSLAVVSIVTGSLTTGNTLTIGARPYAFKDHNNLHFRTIVSDTPDTLKISDDDDALIHISGTSSVGYGALNAGTIGLPVYSGQTNNTFIFKKLLGSGSTTISDFGGHLVINTNAISGVTNGLTETNKVVSLGGTLTTSPVFDGGVSKHTLRYGDDYSSNYINRSLVDKEYVDNIATGLHPKQAVMFATTGSTALSGLVSVDGIIPTTGMRILVKDQSTAANNGIYSASTGVWGRTDDFDISSNVVSGSYLWVLSGNTNKDTSWVLNTPDPIIVGSTPLTYVLFDTIKPVTSGVGIIVSAITGTQIVSFDGNNVAGSCMYWNGSQLGVNSLTQSILLESLTGATNGLTKTSKNVVLGGALTGNTTISGVYTLNVCGGAKLNTQCGYQISGNTILHVSPSTICSVYIGYRSGYYSGTGVDNIGIGTCTIYSGTTSVGNVAIGICALSKTRDTGNYNVGIGVTALGNNTTGFFNVAIGSMAMGSNLTGLHNIAMGNVAVYGNTSGRYNIGVGYASLYSNVSGYDNVAIGNQAGYESIGSNNVFLGRCAGYFETTSNKLHVANSTGCTLIYGDFAANYVTLPTLKLCVAPIEGAITDSLIVWNSGDTQIKRISLSSISEKNYTYSVTAVTTGIALTNASAYIVFANSPSTPITITLPATPDTGRAYKIKDVGNNAVVNNITINGNGKNIDGSASDALINTNGGSVELVYDGVNSWYTLSFVN